MNNKQVESEHPPTPAPMTVGQLPESLVVTAGVVRTPGGIVLRDGQLFTSCEPHDCEPYVETGECTHAEELLQYAGAYRWRRPRGH